MEKALPIYLIVINLVAFFLMYVDKKKARNRQYRIPESVLLWSAFLGGAIGAYMGMKMFRHKTKHVKFTLGVPVAIVTTGVFLYFYLTK
jgi:uncharacterized membrane protein YsdA (DUF1294 family)